MSISIDNFQKGLYEIILFLKDEVSHLTQSNNAMIEFQEELKKKNYQNKDDIFERCLSIANENTNLKKKQLKELDDILSFLDSIRWPVHKTFKRLGYNSEKEQLQP